MTYVSISVTCSASSSRSAMSAVFRSRLTHYRVEELYLSHINQDDDEIHQLIFWNPVKGYSRTTASFRPQWGLSIGSSSSQPLPDKRGRQCSARNPVGIFMMDGPLDQDIRITVMSSQSFRCDLMPVGACCRSTPVSPPISARALIAQELAFQSIEFRMTGMMYLESISDVLPAALSR
jgi:hypothetical protein